MKRKFAFNLAPVKVSSKPTSSEPTPSKPESSSHAARAQRPKEILGEGISLKSPWICRRPLTPDTEKELRAACALILQNFKPSDHGMTDIDPKLDFKAMERRREREKKADPSPHVKVHRPTGAPSDSTTARHVPKHARPADKPVKERPAQPAQATQANTGRRRAEQAIAAVKDNHETKRGLKSPSSEPAARSAMVRSDLESDDAKSVGTPLTGSTDTHQHSGSTAPTSASATSGASSNRTSHQTECISNTAHPHAVDQRNRQELRKKSSGAISQPRASIDQNSQARPPSRAKSITSNIRGYLSRKQSQESINTVHSRSSPQKELSRSESNNGWRSWGLQRMSSSRSSSRPGTSKGRPADESQGRKSEVNLNRELPPLPSLDSWKPQAEPTKDDNDNSKTSGAHIATVMRSQDQVQQDYLTTPRVTHRRSGSDTLALRYEKSPHFHSASQTVQTKSQGDKNATAAAQPSGLSFNSSLDFDEMMSAMDSSRVNSNPPHARVKYSLDASRLEAPAPNFSRKISMDLTSPRFQDRGHPGYQNMVEVEPKADAVKNGNKSKLRKALSVWMLRKEKKEHWMDQFEKNGIKGGLMIQDEPACAPVVRY